MSPYTPKDWANGPEGGTPILDTDLERMETQYAQAMADVAGGFVPPVSKSTSGPAAPLTYVNVDDFGAVGDGVADDKPAIQAALDAAGPGGMVRLPPGVYRCASGITVPTWCTIEANSPIIGAGGSSVGELKFDITGAAVAVTLGDYAVLRNLKLRGPGTAVGTCKGITGGPITLEHVSVINFATGVHLTAAFYAVITRCEFSRNGTGLQLTNCYNVNLIAPRFYCGSTVDDAPGNAIIGAARSLNIFGGSIEGYVSAVTLASGQNLALYGVYFETKANANAGGIWADGRDKVTVTAIGCMVYLNGHTRWITTSASTNAALFARGNHFVAVETSASTPTAYIISPDQLCDIGADNWSEVAKTGATYASATSGGLPTPGSVVTTPAGIAAGGLSSGMTFDGRRVLPMITSQALAVAGAVTLDSRKGDQIVTLTANATSTTISNAVAARQELSITWVQDATGGRTYAWPAICKFAGNAAPTDTTANTRTTVRFRYDAGVGRWHEISRAVAVPNS